MKQITIDEFKEMAMQALRKAITGDFDAEITIRCNKFGIPNIDVNITDKCGMLETALITDEHIRTMDIISKTMPLRVNINMKDGIGGIVPLRMGASEVNATIELSNIILSYLIDDGTTCTSLYEKNQYLDLPIIVTGGDALLIIPSIIQKTKPKEN